MSDPAALYETLESEVGQVLVGQDHIVEGLTVAALTRGHVLLEGVPGIAKTTAANLFAEASGLEYNRIQMTPDLLPADITGTRVYHQNTGEFEFQPGPVFANVVVADEINRATPKTQSALLEAMEERQVSTEGETRPLPEPFLVIATQNPIEMDGVFALPEAQRDRFQMKLRADIPERDDERSILDRFDRDPDLGPDTVSTHVDADEILACQETVAGVYVDVSVKEYVLDLVAATRSHDAVEHGASPRASLAFQNIGKGLAAIQGREYVIPDDVKRFAQAVLAHRLVLKTDAGLQGTEPREVVDEIVEAVEPPTSGFLPEDDVAVESDGNAADGSRGPAAPRTDDA